MKFASPTSRFRLVLVVWAVAGLALAGGVFASSVELRLDSGFGKGGVASVSPAGGNYLLGMGVARTPEGKIVQGVLTAESEAGVVIQYTNGGHRDPAFGDRGIAGLRFDQGTIDPRDVVAGPGGKIFITGEGRADDSDQYGTALASLSPNGRPNRNFAGKGISLPEALERTTPAEMVIDREGRIVLVGYFGGMPASNTVVARFLPGGRLDDSFSGDGVVKMPAVKNQLTRTVAIDRKGRVVVGSPGGAPYRHEFNVARLLPNGRFDRSFGTDGRQEVDAVKRSYEEISDLAIDGKGRILVTGESGSRDGIIVRLRPGGAIDRSFGERGVADTAWFSPAALVLDRYGRIFAVGSGEYVGGQVVRFSRNGHAQEMEFVEGTAHLTDAFVDRKGRLVAAGNRSRKTVAVARFRSGN